MADNSVKLEFDVAQTESMVSSKLDSSDSTLRTLTTTKSFKLE